MKHRIMLHGEKPGDILGSVTEKLQQTGEPRAQLEPMLDDLLQHFQ